MLRTDHEQPHFALCPWWNGDLCDCLEKARASLMLGGRGSAIFDSEGRKVYPRVCAISACGCTGDEHP